MAKLWYPVALAVAMVGCGGDVDSSSGSPSTGGVDTGSPNQTGGQPVVHYGVQAPVGGKTSIDSGLPIQTGGMTPIPPYGVIPILTGGAPEAGGTGTNAVASAGGHASIDTGTPTASGGMFITLYGVIGVVSSHAWQGRLPF
jgi:hypothetical protein